MSGNPETTQSGPLASRCCALWITGVIVSKTVRKTYMLVHETPVDGVIKHRTAWVVRCTDFAARFTV